MQDALREVLQGHLLLRVHLLIPADQVQDEDGWHWLGVPRHQAAELRFQGFLAPLKEGFLAQNSRTEALPALLKTPDALHSLSFKLSKNTQVRGESSLRGKRQVRQI